MKERVFGCDLGEHLLNSGHDGMCCLVVLHFLVTDTLPIQWLSVASYLHCDCGPVAPGSVNLNCQLINQHGAAGSVV